MRVVSLPTICFDFGGVPFRRSLGAMTPRLRPTKKQEAPQAEVPPLRDVLLQEAKHRLNDWRLSMGLGAFGKLWGPKQVAGFCLAGR